ncbi:MAG: hypothetical protein OXN21_07975, partial [Chloroflexota bacterium]|nr:hypothetical protein [Chloroflexota bacterium]
MLTSERWRIVLSLAALVAVSLACSQADPVAPVADSTSIATPTSSISSTDAGDPPAATSSPTSPARSSGSSAIAIAEQSVAATQKPTTPPDSITSIPARAEISHVTPVASPSSDQEALSALYPDGTTLIQLIDLLDEPESYCVDVRGFGSSLDTERSLQAHTCKPGADDELFLFDRPGEGQISMPAYDLCMDSDGEAVYVRSCTDAQTQRFHLGADGTLRTGDGTLCLAVAPGDGEPAGGQSHLRRDLLLVSCTAGQRHLARWKMPGNNPSALPAAATQLMHDALDSALGGDQWDIVRIGDSGDPAYIPVLMEMMKFPWWHIEREVELALFESLDKIVEQNPGLSDAESIAQTNEWSRWVVWLGLHPEIWPPPGFSGWKGRLFSKLVDPNMGAFLYDGMRS